MKVKLLKRIRKRFAYDYDHKKQDWIVTDVKQPFFFIKPLKDYSYAECMYGIMGSISYVNHRRTVKAMKTVFSELLIITNNIKEIKQ